MHMTHLPISGKQRIGFSEVAAGRATFKSTNPNTGDENPWTFFEATEDEANRALREARAASAAFANLGGARRAQFLRAIAAELESAADAIVTAYTAESGLPEGRARGELGRTAGQLRAFADLAEEGSWIHARIDTAQPDRQPAPKPDIRKCLHPLGPVVVFGASNFPLAFSTAGGDTASALAAGCPVVVKGHPMHPATGELVARAITQAARETGMPDGVFSHLQGVSHRLGEWLVTHPETTAVGFTGSQQGGLALARLGQERPVPIPVFAEMGSINPVVLLTSALETGAGWARAYAQSVTLGTGQFCTNPGLLLAVQGPALDAFVKDLADAMGQIPAACMLHKNIAARYREVRAQLLSQPGVSLLTPADEPDGPNRVPATVARVSGADFRANARLQQEVFGPFTLVVACRDRAELEAALSGLEGQLTAALLGNDAELAEAGKLVSLLQEKAGRVLFNGVPTGVEVCPAMQHGGPFPATTDGRFTSVGTDAILRWARPVAYQNCPQALLPEALRDANPLGIQRLVNGTFTRKPL